MKDGIFMSYCRHQMTQKALAECDWLEDLDEDNAEQTIQDCVSLQQYIIELAESFGCEIANKDEVLEDMKSRTNDLING